MSAYEITRGGKEYIGYDYKTATVDRGKASMYLDAYESFGWLPDDSIPSRQVIRMLTLKLKRNRKILNKAELTRLQQHFEACMDEIASLENSIMKMAAIYSMMVGFIGTVFVVGFLFAITNEPPRILLCFIFTIPGFVGLVAPFYLFKLLVRKRTIAVEPLIEQKHDEIKKICEKGNILLHQ